jgi:two-component system, OmpR family, response regulator
MKKTRILIVDDDPNAAGWLKSALERTDRYEVRTETRGRQALAAARQFRPQLILLDVDMPDADGGEVAFQIRADSTFRETPIVFLTAIVSEEEAGASGLLSGGYQFLSKSMPVETLLCRVQELLAPETVSAV